MSLDLYPFALWCLKKGWAGLGDVVSNLKKKRDQKNKRWDGEFRKKQGQSNKTRIEKKARVCRTRAEQPQIAKKGMKDRRETATRRQAREAGRKGKRSSRPGKEEKKLLINKMSRYCSPAQHRRDIVMEMDAACVVAGNNGTIPPPLPFTASALSHACANAHAFSPVLGQAQGGCPWQMIGQESVIPKGTRATSYEDGNLMLVPPARRGARKG